PTPLQRQQRDTGHAQVSERGDQESREPGRKRHTGSRVGRQEWEGRVPDQRRVSRLLREGGYRWSRQTGVDRRNLRHPRQPQHGSDGVQSEDDEELSLQLPASSFQLAAGGWWLAATSP